MSLKNYQREDFHGEDWSCFSYFGTFNFLWKEETSNCFLGAEKFFMQIKAVLKEMIIVSSLKQPPFLDNRKSRQNSKWYQFIQLGILPSSFEILPSDDIQYTLCLDVLLVTSKLVVLNKATFQQKFQQLPICLLKTKRKKSDWKLD